MIFYPKNIANKEHPELTISYAYHVESFRNVSKCLWIYIRARHWNTNSTGRTREDLLLTVGKCAGYIDFKLTLVWIKFITIVVYETDLAFDGISVLYYNCILVYFFYFFLQIQCMFIICNKSVHLNAGRLANIAKSTKVVKTFCVSCV